MTLLLMGLGALAGALGTRAAALAFLAGAVLGAGGNVLPAAAAWSAGCTAALASLGVHPRRLALPALGAVAALGLGSARNAAIVLALWVAGTGVVTLCAGLKPDARRWSTTLLLSDIPLAAAAVWMTLRTGPGAWPFHLDHVATALVMAAAVLRVPLASGPDDHNEQIGLIAVRTQAVVLILVAVGVRGSNDFLGAVAILGAAGFLIGGVARRPATRDVVQELSMVALVAASARLGWGPAGWEWGVLGAGTLIHCLRLRLGGDLPGRLAGLLLWGGGVGLPLLPAVLVGLEGGVRGGGWKGVAVVVGLTGGLAARAKGKRASEPTAPAPNRLRWVGTTVVVALSVAVATWAPLLTFQSRPVAAAAEWPPAWGALIVLAVGAAAGLRPGLLEAPVADRPHSLRSWPDPRVPLRLAPAWVGRRGVGALALLGLALWVVGVARGFL